MEASQVLDAFQPFSDVLNHHKYANNYTYNRAIYLMNREHHLDTGFVLVKDKKELNAPLGVVHMVSYSTLDEVSDFIQENQNDIQCVVGNANSICDVRLGQTQYPALDHFADHVDSLNFLIGI